MQNPKRIKIEVTCTKKSKRSPKRPKKRLKNDKFRNEALIERASITGAGSDVPLELSCIDIRSVTPDANKMIRMKKMKPVDHRAHKGGTFIELHPYSGHVTHNVNEKEKSWDR